MWLDKLPLQNHIFPSTSAPNIDVCSVRMCLLADITNATNGIRDHRDSYAYRFRWSFKKENLLFVSVRCTKKKKD